MGGRITKSSGSSSGSAKGGRASPDALVAALVADHPVVVFSKTNCPYCVSAKRALAAAGRGVDRFAGAHVVELNKRPDGPALQAALARRTGRATVPNVFLAGASVGGGDETTAYARRGVLPAMIRDACARPPRPDAPARASAPSSDHAGSAAPSSSMLSDPSDAGAGTDGGAAAVDPDVFISELVLKHPVVVFSKSYCPYCKSAKITLAKVGAQVESYAGAHIVELERRRDGVDIQAALHNRTGRRTVPNVFIAGVSVGGGDDVVEYARDGSLLQMLREAPSKLAAANQAASSTAPAAAEQSSAPGPASTADSSAAASVVSSDVTAQQPASEPGSDAKMEPAADAKMEPAADVKTESGADVKTESGADVKTESGADVKTESGADVKTESGADVKTGPGADVEAEPRADVETEPSAETVSDPDALVAKLVKEHPVLIFSKTYCPYCAKAKRAIAGSGAKVASFRAAHVVELDQRADGGEIQAALARLTGQTTVPNVFIGGKPVGGGDDVAGYARDGVLEKMLAGATEVTEPKLSEQESSIEKPLPEQTDATTATEASSLFDRGDVAETASEAKPDLDGLISELVDKHPVVLFSKTYCPYCRRAKNAIAEAGADVDDFSGAHVVELDERADGSEIQKALANKTGRTTVPNVFIGGVAVGGGDDVSGHAREGSLANLLRKAVEKYDSAGDEKQQDAPGKIVETDDCSLQESSTVSATTASKM